MADPRGFDEKRKTQKSNRGGFIFDLVKFPLSMRSDPQLTTSVIARIATHTFNGYNSAQA
ncbi:MAG: hypothetical protein CVU43_10000 [Chloroflexi bacterium HGW-Chloroflexi-5]|jgi:hypothetical protein|nr:MAG: hypothetical protein CVU43_10000 [Chloroflexi bacterium HGW-Chloroflexi-5]